MTNFFKNIKIDKPVWNNIFNFEQRKILWWWTIFVNKVIDWNIEDIKIWSNFVFEEIWDNWELIQCVWLDNHIKIWDNIFIVDNHNMVLWYWLDKILKNWIKWTKLVHIDQHSDMNNNEFTLKRCKTIDDFYNFSVYNCNVWNFIDPVFKEKYISNIYQIRTEYSLLNFNQDIDDYILDIDVDFFEEWMWIIHKEKCIDKIISIWKKAKIITIATSPLFIEQNIWIYIAKEILKWITKW